MCGCMDHLLLNINASVLVPPSINATSSPSLSLLLLLLLLLRSRFMLPLEQEVGAVEVVGGAVEDADTLPDPDGAKLTDARGD